MTSWLPTTTLHYIGLRSVHLATGARHSQLAACIHLVALPVVPARLTGGPIDNLVPP
jgi:hypothetical protein